MNIRFKASDSKFVLNSSIVAPVNHKSTFNENSMVKALFYGKKQGMVSKCSIAV